ncbi:MAG: GGDEF domain-containing protein [Clostridiales Family XIII bacterium]|jgi:diguanylate cyclase (GGDEF)-like protein|nr:GGDEF domain-containing protein [Clostridiales Family XIII bacterium]
MKKKRNMETTYFVIFCIPVAIWAGLMLLMSQIPASGDLAMVLEIVAKSAFVLIPTLLCLHVWSHVSYKPITGTIWVIYLFIPVIVIGVYISKAINPSLETEIFANQHVTIDWLLSGIAYALALIKSYRLCFNVFYQMPKHMRVSTYNMLVSISIVAIAKIITLVLRLPDIYAYEFNAVAIIIAMRMFAKSFYFASSSNVIVTSREFVFNSLSTIVLTISLKGNILDWNKRGKGEAIAITYPRYKEPYHKYRERIIEECSGTVSPHDENIITTKVDGKEQQLLFTRHGIGFSGRQFGYLVEISEVTKLYSVLRYLEEIAMFDQLTGLNNRNAYMVQAHNLVQAKNMPLGIIVGDINNLKKTNDTIGHLAGDRLITIVSNALKESVPKSNLPDNAFLARIGGDEVVILIPNADMNIIENYERNVAEILKKVDDPVFGSPTISLGHAIMKSMDGDYNDSFLAADAMMYESKRQTKEISLSGIVPTAQISDPVSGQAETEWVDDRL